MPDVWTKHPEIVRDLLKEAGFKCGVEGRFLKGRDPAWTCLYDGKTMKGDLYIHHADRMRSELRADDTLAASPGWPRGEAIGSSAVLGFTLVVAALTLRWRRRARAVMRGREGSNAPFPCRAGYSPSDTM